MTKEQLTTSRRGRLEFLDALRGLAAAYVIIYHTTLIPQPSLDGTQVAHYCRPGRRFGCHPVLPGRAFSLYFTMPLRLRERHPTRAFFLHRFFRIAPLFYALLVVTLIRDAVIFQDHSLAIRNRLLVAAGVQRDPRARDGIVWASWTIGVEVLFYAAFPLIYRRVRSVSEAIAFFFVCLVAWNIIQRTFLMYSFEPRNSRLHHAVERVSASPDLCRRDPDLSHLQFVRSRHRRGETLRRCWQRAVHGGHILLLLVAEGVATECLR